ncbi:hypothetical protein NliqN6_0130 [Naganishia liquefaciens]|uniref:Uncharacterized protein n=1 Tax=Naganishia liquefaciens TaxID=104408 RepID=A0A8H3TMH3_9TREE|nr:hypothetical protein NliqN6_0130 [Naganishia liquefaciens]
MGRGKIKKVKPVSLQARKAAIAQQQQLQAQKAALERQIAEERSKQARLQREIEEKERLVRGLERAGAAQERQAGAGARVTGKQDSARVRGKASTEGSSSVTSAPTQPSPPPPPPPPPPPTTDSLVPISDKALSMLNHMLGNRGLMQRDPRTGAIDVVLNPETLAADPSLSEDDRGLLAGMNGMLGENALAAAAAAGAGVGAGNEANAETREALAEAMAAMKAAAHVAKALPLMMLKTAAQAMTANTSINPGSSTSPLNQTPPPPSLQPHLPAHEQPYVMGPHGQMMVDPAMMDEHLSEFRAMMEDPEERARLGVGFEMLGWAMGEHLPTGATAAAAAGIRSGDETGALPTLEDMLKLPIFNNEAFRSSPMFGKPTVSDAHQPQALTGELFLESADAPTTIDLHNLDLMSDFLSNAPAMLGGPLFGGGGGGHSSGMSGPGMSMGMSLAMPLRQNGPPSQNQQQQRTGPVVEDDDYPGDLTASEAVKAVTQLLEASSRKLQKVTEEQQSGRGGGGGGTRKDRAAESPVLMNVRLDKSSRVQPQPQAQDAAQPVIPEATVQAILQARERQQEAFDEDGSNIDAISVDGDVDAFDEAEDDEYYSDDDEQYEEDEEYDEDEDGGLYLSDGEEESDYSRDGSSCYDSEAEEEGDDEQYPIAEVMPFHAPIRRKRNSHSAEQNTGPYLAGGPATPPRPHYSTIPYLPGSRRNPVTGKQMREILDRLSPAARHNYQQALIREHQLEMEMEKHGHGHGHGGQHHRPTTAAPVQQPMLQSIPYPVPPPQQAEQARQPSVLDDPAVMDQAVDELFSWIKAVIWTIEQHAIRAARAQMEAKGVSGKTTEMEQAPASSANQMPKAGGMGATTWTPKATPDGERMRAMMRTVGIDVAPA